MSMETDKVPLTRPNVHQPSVPRWLERRGSERVGQYQWAETEKVLHLAVLPGMCPAAKLMRSTVFLIAGSNPGIALGRIGDGHRRQQGLGIGMLRVGADLLGLTLFHDLAAIHDHHAIAEIPN